MKILIVIPARWGSSRFVGKPLAKINKIPMIKRVYEKAVKSKEASDVIVATDDKKISNFCKNENIKVIMTSKSCNSGTDRVYQVSKKIKSDIYVNLQGDEPLIKPQSIDKVINLLKKNISRGYEIATGYSDFKDEKYQKDKSITYLVKSINNEVKYISRSKIPSNFKGNSYKKKAIGLFVFTKKMLKKFCTLRQSPLEINENIEILRSVENDIKVICTSLNEKYLGSVDYPADIKRIEKILNKSKN